MTKKVLRLFGHLSEERNPALDRELLKIVSERAKAAKVGPIRKADGAARYDLVEEQQGLWFTLNKAAQRNALAAIYLEALRDSVVQKRARGAPRSEIQL
jgi:chorismate mutase